MRRILTRLFGRLSRTFGVPELQARVDVLDRIGQDYVQTTLRIRDDFGIALQKIEHRATEIHNSTASSVDALQSALVQDISRVATDVHTVASDLRASLDRIGELEGHTENRIQSLNSALVKYVDETDSRQTRLNADQIGELRNELSRVRESVDALRRQLIPRSSLNKRQPTKKVGVRNISSELISDEFYVAIENHFRGTRALVAERQENYLPLLPQVISSTAPLIDLGCGRGEWLQVLSSRGVPAMGVDANSVCIAECLEQGLAVEQVDLLTFLRDRPDSSVGSYTLFQVLEHLPFGELVEAVREMRRTLVPGGRLIAEVPNAKNLRVAAGTFWIDPTHQRPLYPDLLTFLASEVGFTQVEGVYANDSSPNLDLTGIPEGARVAIERMLETVDTAQDFALVATV